MNSFLFKAFLFLLLINSAPDSLSGQVGINNYRPLQPLNLLQKADRHSPFLKLTYSSPYGIRSFRDISLEYNEKLLGGVLNTSIQSFGVREVSEFFLSCGYSIDVKEGLSLGLSLEVSVFPSLAARKHGVFPGGSIYSEYYGLSNIRLSFQLSNWNSLFTKRIFPESLRTGLAIIAWIKTHEQVRLITGVSYKRGRAPIFCIGTGIIADSKHSLSVGVETAPAGFWLGYSYSRKNIKYLFCLKSAGVFGLEPGNSIQYYFQ